MKAVVLREFGGPEALRYEEVPTPAPGPGEVLVRVHAVSVNRSFDVEVRKNGDNRGVVLPLVLGADPSGVVSAIGEGVSEPRVGDRVAILSAVRCGTCQPCLGGAKAVCPRTRTLGVHRWGGYAEFVAVPAENAIAIPDELSFPQATVIVRHFPAAFHLLIDQAAVREQEWVLVMGAAGALGSSCVQVARLLGAAIIAAAGSDRRVAAATELGAIFGVNYRTQNLADEVARITDGNGVHVVLENIGDPVLWPGAFNSLGVGGRLVTAGAHGGGHVTLDIRRLYSRRIRIIGSTGSNRTYVARAIEEARLGNLKAMIDRVLPLQEAAEAHRLVEANEVLGKIILDPTLTATPQA